MLRTRTPTRLLTSSDRDAVLELCARHPADNVFPAARILEGALLSASTPVLGYHEDGQLAAVCFAGANVVPVETDSRARLALADRVRRWQRRTASLLGPADQVMGLWADFEGQWSPARSVRSVQPHLATSQSPRAFGVTPDPRVRPARMSELDAVLVAAEHMFTHEIGYPPYRGSARAYRSILARLIDRSHTFVIIERGEVIFKADVGSAALGCAQIQGVWVAPRLRGQGLGTVGMAGVVEHVHALIAPTATLYVNHFNSAARATYERIGMRQIGTFATVLL
ncbi:MAG TPA: GNAT family N-acetyltransferase [Tetrasphaera sp.]|uniref:GNAT family N-acetyltransferase n=1 Tax=Nostocoides sp. TaxID=1917966 RepID=UPI002C367606|nr:GNAT family N-acetyltransferase [Tetrasphaera sp.]HNQ08282.1 GNAT family N-acetyltransferase [Tetrasphaera sp.]